MKKCIFGCFCALRYNNASEFNPYGFLEVKDIWPRTFGNLGQRSLVGCLSTFSKGLFNETTWPISFKFYMRPLTKEVKKDYIFRIGHMTSIVTMAIHSKKLKNSFSPEPFG